MNAKSAAYWTTTAFLALALFSGGVAQLMHQPDTMKGMAQLGYPVYFITLLGFWKILGAVALVVPRCPRLKEWAYAGIFFEMTGAAVSHAASGDPWWHVAVTLGFALLTLASWALRPPSRTLGILLPSGLQNRELATGPGAN